MDGTEMFALASALAEAKSRQDVPAALSFLHPEMVLENPAFGTVARGLEANEQALTRFFAAFPDYNVELEGHAVSETALVCWGRVQMTMTGDRFGVTPNGNRVELPVFIEFGFSEGLIARERFFFDLSTLCAQSGVSTDAVRAKLFGEGEGDEAQNRRVIGEAFAGTATGDGRAFVDMLADDVAWTIIGSTSWSRTFEGKAEVLEGLLGPLRANFDGPNVVTAHRLVAEGAVVVAEGLNHSRTNDGEAYDNRYSWTFAFRGGKVVEVTEYCDTALIERVLKPLPDASAKILEKQHD